MDTPEGVNRRNFLQLSAASLALAGLTACTRQPLETIVPYVKMPEDIVPGRPQFYATAMTVGGYATGLLAESNMGRPTKVEGNPEHPASLGGSDALVAPLVLIGVGIALPWGLMDGLAVSVVPRNAPAWR